MYPFIKLTAILINARFRSKLNPEDKSVLKLIAGFTDIDIFMELNNARYFTCMELGRWDFSYRIGLVSLMKRLNGGLP